MRARHGPDLLRAVTQDVNMMGMTMGSSGVGMVVVGLAGLLGLGLLASLIVLVWVAIGRLRRDPTGPAGRS